MTSPLWLMLGLMVLNQNTNATLLLNGFMDPEMIILGPDIFNLPSSPVPLNWFWFICPSSEMVGCLEYHLLYVFAKKGSQVFFCLFSIVYVGSEKLNNWQVYPFNSFVHLVLNIWIYSIIWPYFYPWSCLFNRTATAYLYMWFAEDNESILLLYL